MKNHNVKFKKELNNMADWRGRRSNIGTRAVDKDIRRRKNELRFDDEMDELEDLRRQGVRIG